MDEKTLIVEGFFFLILAYWVWWIIFKKNFWSSIIEKKIKLAQEEADSYVKEQWFFKEFTDHRTFFEVKLIMLGGPDRPRWKLVCQNKNPNKKTFKRMYPSKGVRFTKRNTPIEGLSPTKADAWLDIITD